MNNIYGLYGSGGHGRGMMPVAINSIELSSSDQICFIDDNASESVINGHKVLSYKEFLSVKAYKHYVVVSIADSSVREALTKNFLSDGCLEWTVIAKESIIMDDVSLGKGALLSPYTLISSNVSIGRGFHLNVASHVQHDCKVGDFVTFAPRVTCNGNIIINDHAYIGAGAVIKQGTPDAPIIIGERAIVGMGAVVTKSVPSGVTVVGNPARIMNK